MSNTCRREVESLIWPFHFYPTTLSKLFIHMQLSSRAVLANGWWCSAVGKATAYLAGANGNLLPDLWLSPVGWLSSNIYRMRLYRYNSVGERVRVFVSTQCPWWASRRRHRTSWISSPVCYTSATSTSSRGTTTPRSPTSNVSPLQYTHALLSSPYFIGFLLPGRTGVSRAVTSCWSEWKWT